MSGNKHLCLVWLFSLLGSTTSFSRNMKSVSCDTDSVMTDKKPELKQGAYRFCVLAYTNGRWSFDWVREGPPWKQLNEWTMWSSTSNLSGGFRVREWWTQYNNRYVFPINSALLNSSEVYMRTFGPWWCASRESANAVASLYTSFRPPWQPQKYRCISATSIDEPN